MGLFCKSETMSVECKRNYIKQLEADGYDEQFIRDWEYLIDKLDADLRDYIYDYEQCGKDIKWLAKSIHDVWETCYYDAL